MKINRNNYAEFFIDYFDGNLNEADCTQLFSFLNEHPDLQSEFDSFELQSIPVVHTPYGDKSGLKKPNIDLHNYLTYLIAGLENDLSQNEEQQLNAFIKKHPYTQFEASLFENTILNPGQAVFHGKQNLKRPKVIPFYIQYKYQMAVAAAIAMLLLFSQLFFTANESNEAFTADNIQNEIETIGKQEMIEPAAQTETTLNTASVKRLQTEVLSTKQPVQIAKTVVKKATEIEFAAGPLKAALQLVNVEPIALQSVELDKQGNTIYATVVNEVNNPEMQSQLNQITDNTIRKISKNNVSLGSKHTTSGLLKSWKLQAGKFSVSHSKN